MDNRTVKAGELKDAYRALKSITGNDEVGDLDLALTLARARKKIEPEVDTVEEMESKLARRYAVVDDDGNPKNHPAGGYVLGDPVAYREETRQLRNKEVEIPKLNGVTLDKLREEGVVPPGDGLLAMIELGVVIEG